MRPGSEFPDLALAWALRKGNVAPAAKAAADCMNLRRLMPFTSILGTNFLSALMKISYLSSDNGS
jgi:hypothetical protein